MPEHKHRLLRIRPARGWAPIRPAELWEFKDVFFMLVLRDVRLRYKQTVLGVIWVVLQPLVAGLIFAVIFGRFAKLPSGGQPYLLFVFAGLLGWNLFAGILQRSGNSLVSEAKLVTKVYFPRMLIPFAASVSALVDFIVSLGILFVLLAWYGVWPGAWLLMLPFVIAILVVFAGGVGLWLSALNVRYRDFMYALPFLIQVWLYASPVVYGLEMIPEEWRSLYVFNPMVGLLEGVRTCVLGGSMMMLWPLSISAAIAAVTLFFGMVFFRRMERNFADNL